MMTALRVRNPWNVMILLCVLSALAMTITGCEPQPRLVAVQPPPPEQPGANLPAGLRPRNWGGGSCVHASLIYQLQWSNDAETAALWRSVYSGGETANGIRQKLDAAGFDYRYTEQADVRFLDWVHENRRSALIWYLPNHCIAFAGWGMVDGRQVALMNDNNRPNQWLTVPKEQFLRNWRGYGGFGLSIMNPPAPPLPWWAFTPAEG